MNKPIEYLRTARKQSNFLRAREACAHFRIAPSTLWNWVKTQEGFPKPIKAGARVTLFDIDAIERYIRTRVR